MNTKKKIIIAIVIFIFLGLTVFTFANPNESENKAQGEGNGTTENESKTDEKNNNKEEVNKEENINKNDDNHEVNVNNLLTNLDNSYEEALTAVVNAEKRIDEESYNTAKDLVDDVTDEEAKEELENRLEEVKNGIDAKALVATLESMTKNAANKSDMDSARNYRTDEDIENLVATLSNEDLKEELQSTLTTLALLLDDEEIKINIEDGAILSETTKIEIEDDNEVIITLTKDEDTKEITNGTEISGDDGVYTLMVIDEAFNSETITFTIDTTAPIFVGYPESGFTEEDFVINVDDLTDVTITISKRNASEDEDYPKTVENGYTITEEGSYILEAKDKAGHTTRLNLGVDKNAPQVAGVEDGEHYNTSVTPVVTDLQLAGAIRLNGEKYTSGTEITEEGTYELVATDRVGHTTTITFTIDKSAPTITKVPNGKIVNYSVSPKIEDINLDTVTLIKNGEEVKNYQDNMYELSHEGIYEITACDKAKNCTTVSFEIDKTKPGMTKLQVYNKNNTSSEYVRNGDTVRVLVTFDEKLGTLPTLAIGNNTATFNEISDGKGGVIYSADITIPKDESELVEGTLAYTISGYKDIAGTEGDKLNETLAQMSLTYDRTAPGYNYVGIMNIDQATEGYAKVGDRVWVYVVVDEHLSVEPTITINGVKAKIVQTEDGAKFNADWYKYVGEVVMTEEMAEGEIEFTIDGFKDLAGNPNVSALTNSNINKGLEAIVLDKTAPTLPTKEDTVGTDPYYSRVSFKPQDNIAIDYYIINGTKVDLSNNWISDANYENIKQYLTEGENTIVLYDIAGNKVEKTFYMDWTASKFQPEQWAITLEADKNAKFECPDMTAYVTDSLSGVKSVRLDEWWATNMSIPDQTKIGEFICRYYSTDNAGNTVSNDIFYTVVDTTAPTYKIYKGESTLAVNQIEPIVVDGKMYFSGGITINFNDIGMITEQYHNNWKYTESNQQEWMIYISEPGEHTVTAVDASGNRTTLTFMIDSTPVNVENGVANLTENISLIDQPFYNVTDNTEAVTINGNGITATQYVTSLEKFDSWEGYIPKMGNIFSSSNRSKLTVNNLTFAGSTQSIGLGNYVNGNSTQQSNFETEFNNVNIIGLEVVSFSAAISPATVVYGTATLNNTNIYGTKLSKYDTDPMWPVYDLALTNYSTTTINGGKIGSIITWNQISLTLNNAEVDTILTSAYARDGIIVNSGSKVNLIDVNEVGDVWRLSAGAAKITINAGATVNTLDLRGINENAQITIEDGAIVNTIITDSGEMTLNDWKAANA